MNKQRRKTLAKIAERLEKLKDEMTEAQADLMEVRDEEQDALDNMPESLQEGERGQAMQEAIDNMEAVLDALDTTDFDEILDGLTAAQGE